MQGDFFCLKPPKFSKYNIPCKMAHRAPEIVKEFVLRKFRGSPVKKKTPCSKHFLADSPCPEKFNDVTLAYEE